MHRIEPNRNTPNTPRWHEPNGTEWPAKLNCENQISRCHWSFVDLQRISTRAGTQFEIRSLRKEFDNSKVSCSTAVSGYHFWRMRCWQCVAVHRIREVVETLERVRIELEGVGWGYVDWVRECQLIEREFQLNSRGSNGWELWLSEKVSTEWESVDWIREFQLGIDGCPPNTSHLQKSTWSLPISVERLDHG